MKQTVLLLALLPALALVTPEMDEFLKKDDPDSLYVSLAIGDSCPYKKSKWRNAVDGVLIRARIKPADDHDVGELLLVTTVTCVGISGRSEVVYSIDAEFIKHDVDMDGVWVKVPMDNDQYGVTGVGEKSAALEGLENAVESAVTALIGANL